MANPGFFLGNLDFFDELKVAFLAAKSFGA